MFFISAPYYQKLLRPFLILVFVAGTATAAPGDTLDYLKAPIRVGIFYFPGLTVDEHAADDDISFVLPFSRAGNLMLVKAKADSIEGNFILDTGCPGLVLNLTYFRNYPRIQEQDTEQGGITGMSSALEHTQVKDFAWGNMTLHNVKADLANLGSIENSKGVKILGLLGLQFLKNCEMIIDYENAVIHFYMKGKKGSRNSGNAMLADTAAYQVIPFEITENRIIVRTTMEGKKLRLIIDCAAEVNILDSRLPDKIFDQVAITEKVMLTGVGNKKVEALKGSLATFTIGTLTVNKMLVLITNLEKTCFSHGGCVDGVLGYEFLSLQKIGFNFITRKMYIWK